MASFGNIVRTSGRARIIRPELRDPSFSRTISNHIVNYVKEDSSSFVLLDSECAYGTE